MNINSNYFVLKFSRSEESSSEGPDEEVEEDDKSSEKDEKNSEIKYEEFVEPVDEGNFTKF